MTEVTKIRRCDRCGRIDGDYSDGSPVPRFARWVFPVLQVPKRFSTGDTRQVSVWPKASPTADPAVLHEDLDLCQSCIGELRALLDAYWEPVSPWRPKDGDLPTMVDKPAPQDVRDYPFPEKKEGET